MSIGKTLQPEITRAAEKYLEQYGDPLVMNTYLKITILVLAAICLALAVLAYKSQNALASMHPMIVRINDVGRAEAIDYRNFQYRPQEAENKYYLSRWAELYFNRNRFTMERDQMNSLYFLNGDVQRAVIEQERKNNVIQAYVKDSTPPVSSMSRSRMSFSTIFDSHHIRHGLSSRRCSRIQPIMANSNESDGPRASPMSFERT